MGKREAIRSLRRAVASDLRAQLDNWPGFVREVEDSLTQTGIHDCTYWGEWPTGGWNIFDGDVWPSRPILFKLYPEDQAKEDALWAERREKFQRARAEGRL